MIPVSELERNPIVPEEVPGLSGSVSITGPHSRNMTTQRSSKELDERKICPRVLKEMLRDPPDGVKHFINDDKKSRKRSSSSMIQAFIFDMDGVIIDSEPIHFEVDLITAKHFGADMTQEDLERYVGMTNPEM